MGGTFEKIDGSAVKLGDIGVNELFLPMTDLITTLNEYGGASAEYIYIDADTVAFLNKLGYNFVVGWYDYTEYSEWDEEETLPNYNHVELEPGQSFMVNVSEEGAALVFSGAVASKNSEIVGIGGAKQFLCNCSPVDLTLGQIEANAAFIPMTDLLTTLNEYGGAKAEYVYIDADTVAFLNGLGYNFVVGWYDYTEYSEWDEEETLPNYNHIPCPAGFGFMVNVTEDDGGLIVPTPLKK